MNFKHSLAKQLLFWILLSSSLLTLIITSIHLYIDYTNDMSAIDERLYQVEKSYLPTISSALWVEDEHQISIQMEGILNLPEVVLVQLFREGKLAASKGENSTEHFREGRWPIVYQFEGNEEKLGELYVVTDLAPVYAHLIDKLILTAVTQGTKTFIASLVIFYIVYLLITKHLHHLAESMSKANFNNGIPKPLSLKRKKNKDDELNYVANAYNSMCTALADSFQRIEEQKEVAERANHLKGEFLANISHEVKTPMNGVYGMTHLLLRTPLDKKQFEYAKHIQKSANHMLDLLNSILDFSKIEAGGLQLENHEFNLAELADEVVTIFRQSAHDKNIELLLALNDEISYYIIGDSTKLKQILVNLVNNAIKFTEKGSVCLKVEVKHCKNEVCTIKFSVIDSGIGIDEDKQQHIFEKFTQAENSTTRTYGGTGLGLSISSRLVTMMDGELKVKSQVGVGSCFSFELEFPMTQHQVQSPDYDLAKLFGKKVLVVDDYSFNTKVMTELLESWQMHAFSSNQPELALENIQKFDQEGEPYDLILIDKKMPNMDGYELFSALSKCPLKVRPRVIMTSSNTDEQDLKLCKDKGIDGFISLPAAPEYILQVIQTVVGNDNEFFSAEELLSKHNQSSKKAIIMLVEDSKINQQVCLCALKDYFPDIIVANNGLEAVEIWQKHQIDIVLMDCHMPVMDGFEATKKIREMEAGGLSRSAIIAITASDADHDRSRCKEVGMDDFVAKPYSPEQLFKAIVKQLPKDRMDSIQATSNL
ncbi:response regulator [Thalassotalea fusca]